MGEQKWTHNPFIADSNPPAALFLKIAGSTKGDLPAAPRTTNV